MAREAVLARLAGGSERRKKALERGLSTLVGQGWVTEDTGGRLSVAVRQGKVRLNPRGFGFVVSPEHPQDDVFVPERWLGGAWQDDEVKVWVRSRRDGPGPEGRVMQVVSRALREVVGRVERVRRGWMVVPQDNRLPTVTLNRPQAGPSGVKARPGDMAVATIQAWPARPGMPVRGRLIRVLGSAEAPGMDITVLAAERRLPAEFPPAVVKEAEALPRRVRPSDRRGRVDLSDRLVVTIDGSDAKDLDDAISLERRGSGYLLGVHIADVSYYVPEGSALDLEARQRGTSIYLVDRVIPMLPERLSNGIASLNPHEPRLTVSAWIELDRFGRVRGTRFERTIIRSHHRLTYEGVNGILAGEAPDPHHLRPWLEMAATVRGLLLHRRMQRGAIDFDLPEAKVILDGLGQPVDILLRTRGVAESIIEEFMLTANEAVAHKLLEAKLPGLFRIHEPPDPEKMAQFRELIGALGYRLPREVTPKSLQRLLDRVEGKPEERIVNTVLLRSMRQARYSPTNTGHFGLASAEYTHFTSPIRRYPDLWVHRVLTHYLEGRLTPELAERWAAMVGEVAEIASAREREAMEAERESVWIKQIDYMADKLGTRYTGIVSGVTGFGLFVELPNLVEGLVRLESLPQDHWRYDAVHYRLSGERTGLVFRLGDVVEVEVVRVDRQLRRIDLALVLPESQRAPRRRAGTAGSETAAAPRTSGRRARRRVSGA
ncbi:MAG: ribonuclease R [Firmicutes bacterium]|nr:ribonuclease R [Alicyclobacillaceae bacterium]MCL6498003.1 ribonuclease R [Bacillota bacterium]